MGLNHHPNHLIKVSGPIKLLDIVVKLVIICACAKYLLGGTKWLNF